VSEPILLDRCRYILTLDDKGRILENASMLLDEGLIECVGDGCSGRSGIVVDCRGSIAMPALYNAHTHAAMTMLRGLHDDSELHEWLKYMWRVEAKLTPSIVYLASKLAVFEMASTGTAGFIDMYFHPLETARAAEELGIRAKVGPVLMEDSGFEEWRRKLRSIAGSLKGLASPIVNVHSLYKVSPETVRAAYDEATRLNSQLHIHVAETRREVYEIHRRYGIFPVELLGRIGALGSNTILVHMGWAASWEYRLAVERKAGIVHCPASNMKLATAGQLPLRELLESGGRVALGTDGAASNNSLDMFREMRVAVLLQRHGYWDTSVTALHALSSAVKHGASLLGIDAGVVEEGRKADLVLLDAGSLYLQPLRKDNLISAVVYAATGRDVTHTIVNGRLIYSRGRNLEDWQREAAGIANRLSDFLYSVLG